MQIQLEFPAALATVLGMRGLLIDGGGTLRETFRRIADEYPKLGLHLFDESGGLREHVLCFWNGTNTRWLPSLDVAMTEGDELVIMQAASGG
ncbi:MAG: hypothetical protein CMJ83_18760 [Planctomycetes bacterium]|nr:hypothetical protein [Planctomycetota bacterium]